MPRVPWDGLGYASWSRPEPSPNLRPDVAGNRIMSGCAEEHVGELTASVESNLLLVSPDCILRRGCRHVGHCCRSVYLACCPVSGIHGAKSSELLEVPKRGLGGPYMMRIIKSLIFRPAVQGDINITVILVSRRVPSTLPKYLSCVVFPS